MGDIVQIRPTLLVDHAQSDRALREMMPVMEHLFLLIAATRKGSRSQAAAELGKVISRLNSVSQESPAWKAYLRWLEERKAEPQPETPSSC